MAISTPQRKRQQKLLLFVVLILAITAGIFYFGIVSPPVPPGAVSEEVLFEEKELKEVKMNIEILEDARFRALVPYVRVKGDIPTGRANPFLPY